MLLHSIMQEYIPLAGNRSNVVQIAWVKWVFYMLHKQTERFRSSSLCSQIEYLILKWTLVIFHKRLNILKLQSHLTKIFKKIEVESHVLYSNGLIMAGNNRIFREHLNATLSIKRSITHFVLLQNIVIRFHYHQKPKSCLQYNSMFLFHNICQSLLKNQQLIFAFMLLLMLPVVTYQINCCAFKLFKVQQLYEFYLHKTQFLMFYV